MVFGSLLDLLLVVLKNLGLSVFNLLPLVNQGILLVGPPPGFLRLHSPNLIELIKEAIAAMTVVVAVQEAAALHVLQWVSFHRCFF